MTGQALAERVEATSLSKIKIFVLVFAERSLTKGGPDSLNNLP
jgi:hypothetical protein